MTRSHRPASPSTAKPRPLRTGLFAGLCLLAALPSFSQAQDSRTTQAAQKEMEFIKPFLGETTVLVVKVDVNRLGVPDANGAAQASPKIKSAIAKSLRGFSQMHTMAMPLLQTASGGQTLYATVGIPESKTNVPVFAFRKQTSAEDSQRVIQFLKNQMRSDAYVDGEYLVATPSGVAKTRVTPASKGTQDAVAAALASVSKYPVNVVFAPPEHVWRTMSELSPELPPQLGGGPSNVLTDGVQWAALGADPKQLALEVVVQAKNERAAADFAAHLPKLLRAVHKATPDLNRQVNPELAELLVDWLKPAAVGDQVKIHIEGHEETEANIALLAYFATLFEKTRQNNNVNRFKQILLGMHNYHDVYSVFPPGNNHRDDDDKPMLSWRVHILPFIEQSKLYEEFHLDEPWDSPHNKQLIAKMPAIFATDSHIPASKKIKPGHTTFLAPVGDKTVFGGPTASRLRDIHDGTSNTIAIVEVAPEHARPWTAPQDYEFKADDPLKGVWLTADGYWLSAFCDGSVRRLKKNVSAKTGLHLFQKNDGNPIKFD